MTTPLAELFAKVPSLNVDGQPFAYAVDGDKIVGSWDVVKAKSLYPTEFSTIDKKFSVTVEFDEKKGTWKSKDRDSTSGVSVTSGGLSWGKSGFSGQKSEKSFSFEFGGVNKTDDGVSPVLAWSFDTELIKKPLFDFLEANGWKQKKGLFG